MKEKIRNTNVRFGPAGNDELFYEQGHKSSVHAPKWLHDMGLDALELSFGHGTRMTDKTAEQIGEEAKKYDIKISVHAPYFINLANNDAFAKNYNYIKRSMQILKIAGGTNLVMHVGSPGELDRAVAIQNCKDNLLCVLSKLDEDGFRDFDYRICIETMGRYKPIGTYQEICDICKIDPRIIPCIDFGHINCTEQGKLDIPTVMNYVLAHSGREMHIHFSAIKFGVGGELKHSTLDDPKFGIDFKPLADYIKKHNLTPTIICESKNIMAQDAVKLKDKYNSPLR